MIEKSEFEKWFKILHVQLITHPTYNHLISGNTNKENAVAVLKNICKTHLRSPNILGFLYSIVPPQSRSNVEHNLLEELGREHDGEVSHPELLRLCGKAAGFSEHDWKVLEKDSEQVLKNRATEPLMFGSLAESGLSVALEVFAFEWVLSREASRLGEAFQRTLNLSPNELIWFFHHSEVDIEHAEQGLETLVDYANYYQLADDAVRTIAEITFRDNVFLKRYFDCQVTVDLT